MINDHTLKINHVYFVEVISGRKTFEIRTVEDRNFVEGDRVLLREYDDGAYSGRRVRVEITYITSYEQKPNYVVFAFRIISEPNNPKLT